MKNAVRMLLLAIAAAATAALAQEAPRMYPGTDFPGNDVYAVTAATPEECASRCSFDAQCKAFTWTIASRQCAIKWAVSRFDGSLGAVSGVMESRPIVPPQAGGRPPPVPVAAGPGPSCSAAGNSACAGCSITCAVGQQASCREGEVTGSTSPVCWTQSKCECLGAPAAPAATYPAGNFDAGNANSCVERDRFACRGCSVSCPANEKPICSPSIPGENNTCRLQSNCRCEPR